MNNIKPDPSRVWISATGARYRAEILPPQEIARRRLADARGSLVSENRRLQVIWWLTDDVEEFLILLGMVDPVDKVDTAA